MNSFEQLNGLVAPMDRTNVDTDLIIPKNFLKSIKRSGFGKNLFDDLRYLDEGQPDQDCSQRPLNDDFPLNFPRYQGTQVLLTRANFGCGSSREHAPWALEDFGFRCVIAPSFADIFYNNCFKNGLLPIVLEESAIDQLFQELYAKEGYQLDINVEQQSVTTPTGKVFVFEVDPFRKHCLLNGLDDIDVSLKDADAVTAYETRRRQEAPWQFLSLHHVDTVVS